jgi:signal transduction histidine kinase
MIAEVKAEIHIEGDWPRVLVSPDEMLRMLQNLIGNALKFRVAQRLPLITINSTVNKPSTAAPGEAGTLWPICIADNGVGMATEAPAGASA